MLVKASCVLLLATTAIAARHEPYKGIHMNQAPPNYAASGAVYPIDYNDELTIKNPMVKPGTNLIFNFEQIRRDQPSIVDFREEDIGKYMGRRHKTTTTTTPAPIIIPPSPMNTFVSEESSEEIYNQVPEPRPVQSPPMPPQPQHWSTSYEQPAMLPTGTTAKPVFRSFHDFSGELDLPDSSRIDPKARYPDVDKWPHVATGTPPPPPTPKWKEFEDFQPSTKQPINWNYYQPPSTEFVPVQTQTTPWPTQQVSERKVHRHGSHGMRGTHKFSWEDIQQNTEAPTVAPYKAPAAPTTTGRRRPPPPVPTLTPWNGDSF